MPSKDYIVAKLGIRELHRMGLEGREKSPEADEIREAIDLPLYMLSDEEHEMLAEFSGGLNECSADCTCKE